MSHAVALVLGDTYVKTMRKFRGDLWDWYIPGGRWSNMLRKKDGTRCDQARIKALDLKWIDHIMCYHIVPAKGKFIEKDEQPKALPKKITTAQIRRYIDQQLIDPRTTKMVQRKLECYYEPGNHGEFNLKRRVKTKRITGWAQEFFRDVSWDEYVSEYLLSQPEDTMITVVDCHN